MEWKTGSCMLCFGQYDINLVTEFFCQIVDFGGQHPFGPSYRIKRWNAVDKSHFSQESELLWCEGRFDPAAARTCNRRIYVLNSRHSLLVQAADVLRKVTGSMGISRPDSSFCKSTHRTYDLLRFENLFCSICVTTVQSSCAWKWIIDSHGIFSSLHSPFCVP